MNGTLLDIENLYLEKGRPLIVCDCDEVLMQFVAGLEIYLKTQALYLDLTSFRLMGNIRRQGSKEALNDDEVRACLRNFFVDHTDSLMPVAGAAEALKRLSQKAQIVVLTNLPPAQKDIRARNLARHDMAYPVIANEGLKGPAVAQMAKAVDAPIIFLDDIAHHIASVAQACPHSKRIHFVADVRLQTLVQKAEYAHARCDSWDKALAFIEETLA